MSKVITLRTLSQNLYGDFVVLPQKRVDQVLGVLMWLSRQSAEVKVWNN